MGIEVTTADLCGLTVYFLFIVLTTNLNPANPGTFSALGNRQALVSLFWE